MEKFADAIGDIQVYGQLVRVDLLSVVPGQPVRQGEAPVMKSTGQLILPLEGFVRAYGTMGKMVQQLIQAGVLKATPAETAAVAPAAAAPSPAAAPANPVPARPSGGRSPKTSR